jgi:hypothetical protein
MIYKRLVLLLAWTVLWGGFAVDQLLLTHAHMQSRNIYGDKVMIERDGMKFLVDKDIVSNEKIKNPLVSCGGKDTWEKNLTFQFDFETSEMNVVFTGNKEDLKGVKRFSLKQNPASISWKQEGFDYLNYKTINFELDNNNAKIPISITRSKYESPYYIDFIFEAYTGGIGKDLLCYKSKVLSLNNANYKHYVPPKAFFIDGVLSDPHIKYPVIGKEFADELRYIDEFIEKNSYNYLHSTLPPIEESTVALLHADNGYLLTSEWVVSQSISKQKITEEIVIGMYGDVLQSDLEHLERLLTAIRVVAPTVKISYSESDKFVTLPIHFAKCTKEFSDKFNGCYDNAAGYYHPYGDAQHGWIWVDSTHTGDFRLSILTHELGHALGLNHNFCHSSVMSYSKFSDDNIYFEHIDLMMLHAIHHPDVGGRKGVVSTKDYIDQFDLNRDKIEEYKDDIVSTCHKKPSEYDFLIDLQIGTNE